VRYKVGDGSKALFWQVWGTTFEGLFPELFTIACGKDAWVAENIQLQSGKFHWNIIFTRLVHDWEVEVVLSSLNCCILKE